jgi:D-amino-acid dehydrogenase
MSEHDEILIIGGGVVGACVARALALRGAAVTLLEREPEVCPPEAAVYANCGLVVPSEVVPLASPGALGEGLKWLLDSTSPIYFKPRADLALVRWLWAFRAACRKEVADRAGPVLRELGLRSAELHDERACEGGERWLYRRDGWLLLYETRRGLDEGVADAECMKALGVHSDVLELDQVRELVPALRPGSVAGATMSVDDGCMDPAAFTRATVEDAVAAGARVVTGAEVYGFDLAGDEVRRVRTTAGVFDAGQVVLAAGAWSPALARLLGLRLPIEPAKGYSIDLDRPEGLPDIPLCIVEPHVVVTPLGDGVRLGSTLEFSGWDLRIRPKRVLGLRRGAERVLGLPQDGPVRQVWRGPRPVTPDGMPVIGRSPRQRNVVLATGHCMLGLSLGPITGRLVTELVEGTPPSVDLTLLRPERF